MPPTIPSGVPLVAIVYAKLIDREGTSRGVKPFVVHLSTDGYNLARGIECRILTPRGKPFPYFISFPSLYPAENESLGHARYVRHALTYFRHVRLPSTALLGNIDEDVDPRLAFFSDISQVISGTLSMGAGSLAFMRIVAYVGAKYSMRRKVLDRSSGLTRPILSFSTQYITILTAISQCLVLSAFGDAARELFVAEDDLYMKHFIAAIFKTVCLKTAQSMATSVSDRCGAQGLFEANLMSAILVSFLIDPLLILAGDSRCV